MKQYLPLITALLVLFIIAKTCKKDGDNTTTYEPEPVEQIDTTSATYIVQKLSQKTKLTKLEKKELKEAKQELLAEERELHRKETEAHFKKECLSNCGDCSFIPLRMYVEKSLEDPESFELVETAHAYEPKSGMIATSIKYRCKNSFGGRVTNRAYALVDENCEMVKVWLTD